MGEYARRLSDGQNIKIGTCESMYYLRADQRHLVKGERGNVDPNSSDALSIRFRFPWPDEDHIEPGSDEFHDNGYERAIQVRGMQAPIGVEHYTVQFSAHAGYLVSLPCPEGVDACTDGLRTSVNGLTVHRNGFSGAVKLVQQKLLADGRLVPVCQCGGCGAKWRVEDPSEIEALAVAFRAEGDSRIRQSRDQNPGEGRFWHQIADRILAGAHLYLPLVTTDA